ncbi:MAG: LPS export ABC transporter permease LptF [Pseudomonadota bacterium]
MAKTDRYMLSQLFMLFGFFSLVLVALFWINRAVVLFDRLIGDGQSALVFLEFTALGLPRLITTVLPIATFAAAVYVTNRMSSESELTVMKATGTSPWRMARPVLLFGVSVAVMMSVLTHLLVPLAQAELNKRESEISQNISATLLREGQFLHPVANVTFYTREIGEDGVLRDVFLSDRRNPDEGVIYTAAQAYLVRSGTSTTLIMVDGLAQRLAQNDTRLATANFRDFSFDISSLVSGVTGTELIIANLITPRLLGDWAALQAASGESRGAIAEELHSRFVKPLFCVAAALVGFSTLLIASYSRFGVWREIGIAFALLIALDGMRGSLISVVRVDATLWPVLYSPVLLGLLLGGLMLWISATPGLFRYRRRAV